MDSEEQERAANIAAAKARWGENHWWKSEDARTRAYHQLHEKILLGEFGRFHEDVETLLGRPVWTYEFGSKGMVRLRQEAKAAWQGTPYSEERKAANIQTSFQEMAETGKLIVIQVEDNDAQH